MHYLLGILRASRAGRQSCCTYVYILLAMFCMLVSNVVAEI